MRRGRWARGVTERHPLVKECAGRTTQPSFLHFTVVHCTFTGIISHLNTLNTTDTVPCTVFFAGQLLSKERQWRRRSRNASSLRLATLTLWIWHQTGKPKGVGLELLADNRQINRHCLFSKKKLLYWEIFWMFLDILDVFGGREGGGKWRRLEVTRRGRGSDGFCSLRGISYSPRATDWHTCTGRIVPMLRIVMRMKMRIVMTTMMLTTKQPTHPGWS